MKKLLVFAAVVALCWYYFHESAGKWKGIPAARDPVQTTASLPRAFSHDEYTITPLAKYSITAVVLGRERYRHDAAAEFAPVDLALGWGPMSVADVINGLKISQSGRWYDYSWFGDPPLDPGEIARHSANTHCLPATKEIRKRLLEVKRHELVSMEGYLVEVNSTNGYRWRSSLSRDDTRGGACEILWVTSVKSQKL